jgi:hypothetical protein
MEEAAQTLIAAAIATAPASAGLRLIGGFRYRLLDKSARLSADIDYHCDSDLQAKQHELLRLLRTRVVPELKRAYRVDADAWAADAPGESPAARVVELACWRPSQAGRTVIPIDLTRIACADPPVARTIAGIVYLTASDADLIEGKIIALLNRTPLEHRDFCDLFLFSSHLRPDSPQRLTHKLRALNLTPKLVQTRLSAITAHPQHHARQIQHIILTQLESPARENLIAAGGGAMIFTATTQTLLHQLAAAAGEKS